MKYDFLIVGAGFFGSICARELTDAGYKCLVIDNRNHIGGNCYTKELDGINVHIYGPHIFHTSDVEVWNWVNRYAEFSNFKLSPVANYKGEIYSLPFNMWTFNKLWGVITPEEATDRIKSDSSDIEDPKNLEEQAIKLVGKTIYEKLIKGYTAKQWKKDPKLLPKEIIKRLPVRFSYDNNYFNDTYQGIPVGGYTQIFEKLLDGIDVRLETDYFENRETLSQICQKTIYTGPIDRFYNYEFGHLEYKTTRFDHKKLETPNYQGTPVMNFTDQETQFTRIIEHKHFENSSSDVTWVTWEYPEDYDPEKTEPYYPVNDAENNEKYSKYLGMSKSEDDIYFGGRLAEYKYYDMHQVIRSALDFVLSVKNKKTA
jgi:UDP-galactopyranose mutase